VLVLHAVVQSSKFKVQGSKAQQFQLRSVNSPERFLTARCISNLAGLFAM
jgi:hypothetical protein